MNSTAIATCTRSWLKFIDIPLCIMCTELTPDVDVFDPEASVLCREVLL